MVLQQVYGSWLREEHDRDLLFVNISNSDASQQQVTWERKLWDRNQFQRSLTYHFDERKSLRGFEGAEVNTKNALIISKDKTNADLNLAKAISLSLDTLDRTLHRQLSGDIGEIQAAVLNQVRLSNYDPQTLAT